MAFGTRFDLLKVFFILQWINKVYSSYCYYYPNYPSNYDTYTTYCTYYCCSGYPVNDYDACCSSTFPLWIIPIIVAGILFAIVMPIIIITIICCLVAKKKRQNQIRQQAMMGQIGSTVPVTQPYTIGYNPNQQVYNMNSVYNPSVSTGFNNNQISFGNNPSYGLNPTVSNAPTYDPYGTSSTNPIQQKNSFF